MIINPTAKAQVIFNKLPKVSDKNWGRNFSEQNPFFSWHANYLTVNRKKVVLLVNDLTFMPLVLMNIDAVKKQQLDTIIPEGIAEVFLAAGISSEKVREYLDLAGSIEVNAGYNRRVTGISNNMILFVKQLELDFSDVVNVELSLALSELIVKNEVPFENLQAAFTQPLTLQEVVVKTTDEPDYQVNKNWQSLAEIKTQDFSDEEYEAVTANNQLILQAFQQYLKDHDKLAEKTVKRHVVNVNDYLNNYLVFYGLDLAVSDFEIIDEFFAWGSRKGLLASETAVKKMGSSLKKFYQFLLLAGEVKKSDMPEIRDAIELGIESGELTLMIEDWY